MASEEDILDLCNKYKFLLFRNKTIEIYTVVEDRLSHLNGLFYIGSDRRYNIPYDSLDDPYLLSKLEEWIMARIVTMMGEE